MNIAYISILLCISCLNSYLMDNQLRNETRSVKIILQKGQSNIMEVEADQAVILQLPYDAYYVNVDSLKVFHFDQLKSRTRYFNGSFVLKADILSGNYEVEIRTDMDKPTRAVYSSVFRKKENISCQNGYVKCKRKHSHRLNCDNGICCINKNRQCNCRCDRFFHGPTCSNVDYFAVNTAYNKITSDDSEDGFSSNPEMSDDGLRNRTKPITPKPSWVLIMSVTGIILMISLIVYICFETGLFWSLLFLVIAFLRPSARPMVQQQILLQLVTEV